MATEVDDPINQSELKPGKYHCDFDLFWSKPCYNTLNYLQSNTKTPRQKKTILESQNKLWSVLAHFGDENVGT